MKSAVSCEPDANSRPRSLLYRHFRLLGSAAIMLPPSSRRPSVVAAHSDAREAGRDRPPLVFQPAPSLARLLAATSATGLTDPIQGAAERAGEHEIRGQPARIGRAV